MILCRLYKLKLHKLGNNFIIAVYYTVLKKVTNFSKLKKGTETQYSYSARLSRVERFLKNESVLVDE